MPNWINNRLVTVTMLRYYSTTTMPEAFRKTGKICQFKKCPDRRSEMGCLSLESGRKKPEGETADPVWRRGQLRSQDVYGLRIKTALFKRQCKYSKSCNACMCSL